MGLRKVSKLGAGGLLVLALGVSGCTPASEAPTSAGGLDAMEPVKLKLSDGGPETGSGAVAMKAFAEEITRKTDGKVTFEYFWNGSLHPAGEALSALESGLVDISFLGAASFPEELPIANWFNLIGSTNQSDAWPLQQMQASPALVEQYETNEELRAEFADLGLVPLAQYASTSFDVLCNKPVETLEQAQGTLIRTAGEPWLGEAEALGMSQVNVDYADLYEALQRGVINCVTQTPSALMATGVWDVAKYYTPAGMSGTASALFVMNKEVWDGLPAEVQEIVNEAKPTFTLNFMKANLDRYKAWAEEGEAKGVQYLDGSKLREAVNDHQVEVNASLIEKAPAGISDPQGASDRYRDSLDNWLKAAEEDFGISAEPLSAGTIEETYLAIGDLDWKPFSERLQELASSAK